MGVRNHIVIIIFADFVFVLNEPKARPVGLFDRSAGFVSVHARTSPKIVTVRAVIFREGGSRGSGEGRIRSQFSAAPPEIPPNVSHIAGDVRSLLVLEIL